MLRRTYAVAPVLLCLILVPAFAEEASDSYRVLRFDELTLLEGEIPEHWAINSQLRPYAFLDGPGEVYVGREAQADRGVTGMNGQMLVGVRGPIGKALKGTLIFPNSKANGVTNVRFEAPSPLDNTQAKPQFLRLKQEHYEELVRRGIPGTAWFRYQARSAEAEREGRAVQAQLELRRNNEVAPRVWNDELRTYEMFSGGRAVAENLQLDRLIPETEAKLPTVPLDDIQGITVAEFDWSPLLSRVDPQPDPLAPLIPHDQHALFFPSFADLLTMIDEATLQGTPVLRIVQRRSEHAGVRERYQRQLCLPLDAFSRTMGDQVVRSVAITGGDPYFRTGTDIAVLFETATPAVLRAFLTAAQGQRQQAFSSSERVVGTIASVNYQGVRTPDRSLCSYVAELDGAVVVSNSLIQLRRIVETSEGRIDSLSSLPEYHFFRTRYPRVNSAETAFLMVSDATIRRWSGPKWRIAASRRTRAAAVIDQLQAMHLDELSQPRVTGRELQTRFHVPDMGTLSLTENGVTSTTYNDLQFLTPISELELPLVTPEEADLYRTWRDGYQQNWSRYFDPIAVSIGVDSKNIYADLTVMPLIAGSTYRTLVELTGESRIAIGAGDPHPETLLHLVMAMDIQSNPVQDVAEFVRNGFLRRNFHPLSWMGETVSLYVDDAPVWTELATSGSPEEQVQGRFQDLPIAFHADVKNPLKLAAFLTGLRGYAEGAAPGVARWHAEAYKDHPYVRVGPVQATPGVNAGQSLYYSASPDSLVVSLNKPMIERAIDRQIARESKTDDERKGEVATEPWLGESLALQVDPGMMDLIAAVNARKYQRQMQSRSWSNIPILNEWRKNCPDQDPIEFHTRWWHRRPADPAGGRYVWDETHQTYASTTYGWPGEPKDGPVLPTAWKQVKGLNMGLTFENDGLRARASIQRRSAAERRTGAVQSGG